MDYLKKFIKKCVDILSSVRKKQQQKCKDDYYKEIMLMQHANQTAMKIYD